MVVSDADVDVVSEVDTVVVVVASVTDVDVVESS